MRTLQQALLFPPGAQEMRENEHAASSRGTQELDMSDLAEDPELEKLHRDRLAELQREVAICFDYGI